MSYNTRRQTGQGMGIGRGTSQVLYHQTQAPPRPGGVPRMAQSQNTSYSSQQNSGYGSQGSGPAYSTQTTPPSSNAPSSQGGYSTQSSFQSQQQQQPIKSERPQTPVTAAAAPPPAPAVTSTPATPAASAPAPAPTPTPAAAPAPAPSSMDVDANSTVDGSSEVKPKPWLIKKGPGFKVNKRMQRRRQNARLRKMLQPKNAIMVLNELKTGIKFTFQEHVNALTQTMFVVNAEVDGKSYIGQGLSKPLAKQNAAENALKALLLEKMAEAALKVSTSSGDGTETMQQDENNGVTTNVTPGSGSTADSAEGSDVGSEGSKSNAPEDDVPWRSLASFALYKLFTEWQSQGTHVPIQKLQTPVVPPNQPVKTGPPAPMKKIPDNPTERHPVMLLNQLRPGVQFAEISREGTTPNLTFTLGVTVDGKSYVGVAKNKKDAKKEAAKSALAGTFNIFYE